jgi:hypothetical protein
VLATLDVAGTLPFCQANICSISEQLSQIKYFYCSDGKSYTRNAGAILQVMMPLVALLPSDAVIWRFSLLHKFLQNLSLNVRDDLVNPTGLIKHVLPDN